MVRRHAFGITALALLGCTSYVAAGCGGNTNTNNSPQTQNDAGEENVSTMPTEGGASSSGSGGASDSGSKGDGSSATDGNTPSSTYPAFPVDIAQVMDNGGSVLSAPHIVTVTWSSDPQAATWNAFDDAIGGSTYWHAVNSEYGVGPATSTSADHVSITTAAPTALSDQDLDTMVSTNVGNGTWPANTPNTIYAIYMPPGTGLDFGGSPDAGGFDACQQGVGGYHEESQTGSYVYAIMPQCPMFQAADIEISASHELNEASTDPHPNSTLAYAGFDQNHLSYEFFQAFQDELGDACELYAWTSFQNTETDFPYWAQRQWSNASGRAGHNPCVPVPTDPNYSVTVLMKADADGGLTPTEETPITVDLTPLGMGAGPTQTMGFKGTLNKPLTFHLGAYSDAPTSGPWTVTANVDTQFQFPDQNNNALNNGAATVTLDNSSVVNGDTITVTVTPTSWGQLGCVYIWFKSLLPGKTTNDPHVDYPIIISEN